MPLPPGQPAVVAATGSVAAGVNTGIGVGRDGVGVWAPANTAPIAVAITASVVWLIIASAASGFAPRHQQLRRGTRNSMQTRPRGQAAPSHWFGDVRLVMVRLRADWPGTR